MASTTAFGAFPPGLNSVTFLPFETMTLEAIFASAAAFDRPSFLLAGNDFFRLDLLGIQKLGCIRTRRSALAVVIPVESFRHEAPPSWAIRIDFWERKARSHPERPEFLASEPRCELRYPSVGVFSGFELKGTFEVRRVTT